MMSTATQGSAGTTEAFSPKAKMENEIKSKPRKPLMTTKQREFTFTGYDIMADSKYINIVNDNPNNLWQKRKINLPERFVKTLLRSKRKN